GVVASLLPFRTSSCLAASSARTATRARAQIGGPTLPAANTSDGSRQNQPTLDSTRGALVPIAKGFRLSALKRDVEGVSCREQVGEVAYRRTRLEPRLWKRWPVRTVPITKNRPEGSCRGSIELSTISYGSTELI